jgi:hypothetical protein
MVESIKPEINSLKEISTLDSIKGWAYLQPLIFETVTKLIKEDNLTTETFETMKHLHLTCGQSVEGYVSELVASQAYKWVENKLEENISFQPITLSPVEEEALRKLSRQTHTPPNEVLKGIIKRGLDRYY